MYPEVHTLADANLRWSGVEAQCSPRWYYGHRNLLTPSHYARCRDSTKGPLRAVTEPVQTRLGQSPQLNWRLPTTPRSFTTMAYGFEVTTNARGNLHNLIGDPDACPELYTTMIELQGTTKLLGCQSIREEQYLGYQVPKVISFSNFTSTYHRGELKPMQLMQWQEHMKWSSPSHSNPSTTTKAMEKYEKKNKELTKNAKIKIQGVPLT